MNTTKNHSAVTPTYDQDWINGISENDYQTLDQILKSHLGDDRTKKVLDFAGGSGKLARRLSKNYNAYLFDHIEGLVNEAVQQGLSQEKAFVVDVLNEESVNQFIKVAGLFDAIVIKSSTHEFPQSVLDTLYAQAFKMLAPGGIFLDWDVHEPTGASAQWLKKWVNKKDEIAGLKELVTNRNIFIESDVREALARAGFQDVHSAYHFAYHVSVLKMSSVYWGSDEKNKTQQFLFATKELLQTCPEEIGVVESDDDVILSVPAVIVSAKK